MQEANGVAISSHPSFLSALGMDFVKSHLTHKVFVLSVSLLVVATKHFLNLSCLTGSVPAVVSAFLHVYTVEGFLILPPSVVTIVTTTLSSEVLSHTVQSYSVGNKGSYVYFKQPPIKLVLAIAPAPSRLSVPTAGGVEYNILHAIFFVTSVFKGADPFLKHKKN